MLRGRVAARRRFLSFAEGIGFSDGSTVVVEVQRFRRRDLWSFELEVSELTEVAKDIDHHADLITEVSGESDEDNNDKTDTMKTREQYCQAEPQSWDSEQPQPPRASIDDVDYERGDTAEERKGDATGYTADCTTGADIVISSDNEAV